MNKDNRLEMRLSEEDLREINDCVSTAAATFLISKRTKTYAIMAAVRYFNKEN